MPCIDPTVADHFKMFDMTPEAVITVSTLRYQTVDMRIPFQIPAKCVKNHNKSGGKILGFIHLKKHAGDNARNRMEQTVK